MEKSKILIENTLNILYEENKNFSKEGNYIQICTNLMLLIKTIKSENYYDLYKNEQQNTQYLIESKKKLTIDNNDLYNQLVKYRNT
jgi:hypothetical protein